MEKKRIPYQDLFDMYIKQNMSIREIAEKNEMSFFVVKHQIEDFGFRKKDYKEVKENVSKIEEAKLKENDIEISNLDEIPMEWKSIFFTLLQMYGTNEVNDYVRYVKNKNLIKITLEKKKYNPDDEFKKVKSFLNYDTLEYNLTKLEKSFIIEIKPLF